VSLHRKFRVPRVEDHVITFPPGRVESNHRRYRYRAVQVRGYSWREVQPHRPVSRAQANSDLSRPLAPGGPERVAVLARS
jgi:hypothetical protein